MLFEKIIMVPSVIISKFPDEANLAKDLKTIKPAFPLQEIVWDLRLLECLVCHASQLS